jgi:hypothetical protein
MCKLKGHLIVGIILKASKNQNTEAVRNKVEAIVKQALSRK